MPEKMNALVVTDDRGFKLATVDRPQPAETEVLIKVEAIGINPADASANSPGLLPPEKLAPVGMIMGWDLAGTVVGLGVGVTRFKIGDRVFGMPNFPSFAHSYAEYACSRSRQVAKIPDSVSFVDAGAIPLAGLTAWQTLVDTAKVKSGDRVLIHAASGGVGHLAVQIAKSKGAEVWGTASARNHEQLRELGADHLIDYREEKFEDVVSDLDIVLVLGGGPETAARSVSTLKPNGNLVCVAAPPPSAEVLKDSGVTASFFLVEPDYKSLESLADLMDAGKLKVVISAQRKLSEMGELHAMLSSGSPLGKLVAIVD